MEDHVREKCKLRPLPCPYKCGALLRDKVSNHIENDCPLAKIPCPYAWMGCRTEVQRHQLKSHINHATQDHLDLACGELRETQKKLKEKAILFDRLEERVNERLKDKLKDIQHQHQYKVDSLQQEHQRRVGVLQKQLEQKVKTCETKLEQKIRREGEIFLACMVLGLVFLTFCPMLLEDRVQNVGMVKKELDDKFDSLNTDLSNKLLILEVDTEESRTLIWKITSFEDKLRQGKNNVKRCIESVPFYAYGYKLMLGLYPNGNGIGKNTHLSIFIAVVKGEYDAILPWGFSKHVTFTLIDQQDNPNQRQNVSSEFTADPNKKVFEKPVEQEGRSWFGFPKFVSHNHLRTRSFLVDDTLFIKVQVDSPKAYTSWF